LSSYNPEQKTEGPGEKRKNGQEKSQKKDEERRKESKTSTRPYVGFKRQSKK